MQSREAAVTVTPSRKEWEALRKPCQHSRTVANVADTSSRVPGAMKSVTLPCAECED